MLFDEPSPCVLQDVYEILIFFLWLPRRVEHHNSSLIDLDTEQDPVKVVEIDVMKKKLKGSSHQVVRQIELMKMALIWQHHLMTWVHEADVVDTLFSVFLYLRPT